MSTEIETDPDCRLQHRNPNIGEIHLHQLPLGFCPTHRGQIRLLVYRVRDRARYR